MFATIKGLSGKIEHDADYININLDMIDGKLDNPNGYSRDFILAVVSGQLEGLRKLIDRLEEQSCDNRLITKYRRMYAETAKRFNEM